MATKKKLLQAAAGAAGGAGLNVEEVFSTYLYDGTGSAQTITNGIDLDGEGGLVWIKDRDNARNHMLQDSERSTNFLFSDLTNAEVDYTTNAHTFNSNGFTINGSNIQFNQSGSTYASWTFRKAPKFFDVVTYTGDGVAGREIAHNLGTTVGSVIIKCTSGAGSWQVWHREGAGSGTSSSGQLDSTAAFNNALVQYYFGDDTQKIDPTSTVFTVSDHSAVNASGSTYVAYLFAHNDGDGEFGPDADADIIKCGSVSGSSSAQTVDLGFEPQFILYKRADDTAPWRLHDVMRGMPVGNNDAYLEANASSAEADYNIFSPTPTGFRIDYSVPYYNTSGGTYIYIAIRRGPMAVPESATDVFYLEEANNPNKFVTTGFVTDLALQKHTALSSSWYLADRLRGENKWLSTNTTGADLVGTDSTYYTGWDYMNGVDMNIYPSQSNDHIFYMCKRAPNFFDVVAYDGDATASPNSRDIQHNLGVAPEMMWIKCRTASENWAVYHSGIGATKYMNLNGTAAAATSANWWRNTAPTDTVFTIGHQDDVNLNGGTHIAYLFASLAGVSKVGSYTGNGSTQTIDCGFSAGARFILIKRTDSTGDWYVWDTARGIVARNDPHLSLNTTAAEVTTDDSIDPVSSGFAVNQVSATNINVSSATYIFYAVA